MVEKNGKQFHSELLEIAQFFFFLMFFHTMQM